MPARLAPICPVARSRCQLRRAPPAAYNPCGASLAAVDTATSSSAPAPPAREAPHQTTPQPPGGPAPPFAASLASSLSPAY